MCVRVGSVLSVCSKNQRVQRLVPVVSGNECRVMQDGVVHLQLSKEMDMEQQGDMTERRNGMVHQQR